MQCPKCNSENTQRLEVVFSNGTQDIKAISNTAGGGVGGALGIGGAVTKTTGKSQSLLAKKISPPQKKPYKWPVIFILFGLLVLMANSPNNVMGGIGAFLVIGGPGAYLAFARFKYNSNKWPGLYQHWLDSWLCNKCGTVYHHA